MEPDLPTNPPVPPSGTALPPDGFLSTIFLKNDGLRTGWRLLLYAFFVEALKYSGLFLASAFIPFVNGISPLVFGFAYELASFLVVFAAAAIMAQIEKRPVGAYGLPLRGAFRGLFWQGCVFGLIEVSAVVSLMAIFGGYSFGSLALHGGAIILWGAAWAVGFLVVGFYEEFAFRGYSQFTLGEGIGFWPAAVILSAVFGLMHRSNPGENSIGLAGVMLVGLFWSFTLRRTGNLWFAVGMHAGFDFGETFVFSVPNSGLVLPGHLSNATLQGPTWLTGGTVGPEASVFDFAIIVVFFFVFNWIYPARSAHEAQP